MIRLGRWFAEPMARTEAEALLARALERGHRALRRGRSCLTCRLAALSARFQLGEAVEGDYRALLREGRGGRRGQALTELLYGQLLLSRKLAQGLTHLQRGLTLATPLLAPADYFRVNERHALLAALALADPPAAPLALEALLTEARVIRRLRAPLGRPRYTQDPEDTLG